MFNIAMNEKFTGTEPDMTNTGWGGSPTEDGWPKIGLDEEGPIGFILRDNLIFACNGCTPAAEHPGPFQNPPKSLSTTKVQHHFQQFWAGSEVPGGNGVNVQTNKQQLYIDNGRNGTIISPVN